MPVAATPTVRIIKLANAEKVAAAPMRYTLGVVYEPDVVDAHGDYARAGAIEKACHDFNRRLLAGTQVAKSLLGALAAAQEGYVELTMDLEAVEKGMLGLQHGPERADRVQFLGICQYTPGIEARRQRIGVNSRPRAGLRSQARKFGKTP
jgi:hypothetical protein